MGGRPAVKRDANTSPHLSSAKRHESCAANFGTFWRVNLGDRAVNSVDEIGVGIAIARDPFESLYKGLTGRTIGHQVPPCLFTNCSVTTSQQSPSTPTKAQKWKRCRDCRQHYWSLTSSLLTNSCRCRRPVQRTVPCPRPAHSSSPASA